MYRIHTIYHIKAEFQAYMMCKMYTDINILRFGTHEHEGHSEGSVSQIFYLGPSVYFMKSRKISFKK